MKKILNKMGKIDMAEKPMYLSKKLLIFHPTIAPYRIDFFNDLYKGFDTKISLFYRNLKDQKFNYEEIEKKLVFSLDYFSNSIKIGRREIPVGFIVRIKKFNPDIVLINEYNESFWFTWLYRLLSGKKYKIISISDDSINIINCERGLHAKARDKAIKYIDGIILCNDSAQVEYKKKYPNIKTYVMPIIQDESKFLEEKEWIVKKAKEIIQDEQLLGKRVFLYVGRISPEKNLLYLVKSFVALHKKNSTNILYVVGNCISENQSYNDEIDEYIKLHNATSYVKKIGRKEGNELKAWFYVGQVLVIPSTREAFGAVANEALLCGEFVMISSIAGATCLVNDENGEIIDVSKAYIDFKNIIQKVPLLSMDYIDKKENKMNCSYMQYMNGLKEWIDKL